MIKEDIKFKLFELQDKEYRDFQSKLIPNIDDDRIIGVRTPLLRQYSKQLINGKDIDGFLCDLPHYYFDENQLHAFIISEIRDYDTCICEVCRFLPHIDNWATCDQLSPKVFKKNKNDLFEHIKKWIISGKEYTVRFGVGMLMEHFLDDDFNIKYPELVAGIRSEKYYINMMIAWYFATALAKQYDTVISFIESLSMDVWTHNKAIQKALESRRITDEQKIHLKSLKIKK